MKSESEKMQEHQRNLIALRRQLDKEIEKAPAGRLRISEKNTHTEYYLCEEGIGTSGIRGKYLGKKDEKMIKALAQKDYDNRLRKEVTDQIIKIENFPYGIGVAGLRNVYESMPDARKKYIVPRIKPVEKEIEDWLAIPYEPKGFEETDPEIYTDAHERVRSKSEKFIAQKLKMLGIPYKYECPLYLVGYGVVYPDFTILNRNTMEVSYLEHLGKMDDPEYSAKVVAKVRNYERTGIYVGRNLFLTMETKQIPFDAQCIEAMLKDFI